MTNVKISVIGMTVIVTFRYSAQLNLTFPFLIMCIHMMVASVPIGKISEPISLPITPAR
ncbi:hypothetical protein D3C84_1312830 [compost metagenome]